MKKHLSNKEIADILFEMSALYEMEGTPWKPAAYETAAHAVMALSDDAYDLFRKGGEKALDGIDGIGKAIAEHLMEIFTTGHFKEYERMKKKMPVHILELTSIEGVGPKTVRALWQKLKIKNRRDLLRAAKAGKLARIPHFGKKSQEKILKGIEFREKSGGRFILGDILPEARGLLEAVRHFPETERAEVAGSVRRFKETIGDIDILAVSKNPRKTMERFVKLPAVAHVYGTGATKTNVRLKSGIDADFRVVPVNSWGAALNYFTGSKEHNIALREIAIKKGWKLNEYGLFKGKKQIAGETEEDLYKAFGLDYIPPELREMTGEIGMAREGKLPALIKQGDLKGDLQVQTSWTDGNASIEKMAEAAEAAGLSYIAITDHTRALAMTGGLDEKGLARQGKEIDALNMKRKQTGKKLVLLKGAEVNIGKDGSLDIEDETLAKLDIVGAAIHSHFGLPRAEQTARVIRAMENPHVDIIFHLTARRINRREPIDVNIDEIIAAAKRTKTILEIDAYPNRLDIKDEYIKKCAEAGVRMSIDSDAHAPEHFLALLFGIGQARRGFAEKKHIVNTLPVAQFLKTIKPLKS
ncbi:DNA polymerase/3'-5' exonuclease PolX [bacterium]|nr:DNA polymerase/3'-5' exonuclease PolX [bacterium]